MLFFARRLLVVRALILVCLQFFIAVLLHGVACSVNSLCAVNHSCTQLVYSCAHCSLSHSQSTLIHAHNLILIIIIISSNYGDQKGRMYSCAQFRVAAIIFYGTPRSCSEDLLQLDGDLLKNEAISLFRTRKQSLNKPNQHD